jgi:hypothetical protein
VENRGGPDKGKYGDPVNRGIAVPAVLAGDAQTVSFVRPNVRAKLLAEAGCVSPACDDAPCATGRAYTACRSGSA